MRKFGFEKTVLAGALGICMLGSASVMAAEYPLTVTHALGETVIEEEAQNIVTIGWGNLDVPLALGIAPVGVSKCTYGATDENGLFSWTNEAFAALGVDEPNVFDDTDGLDFEAINNAEPDLILGVYSGLSEEEYEQLSEIAPTVPYTKEAWVTTWQDMTRENGIALGKEEEAEAAKKNPLLKTYDKENEKYLNDNSFFECLTRVEVLSIGNQFLKKIH